MQGNLLEGTAPKHSNLLNITPVAIKVHMRLRKSAVLTWMHDNRELV